MNKSERNEITSLIAETEFCLGVGDDARNYMSRLRTKLNLEDTPELAFNRLFWCYEYFVSLHSRTGGTVLTHDEEDMWDYFYDTYEGYNGEALQTLRERKLEVVDDIIALGRGAPTFETKTNEDFEGNAMRYRVYTGRS